MKSDEMVPLHEVRFPVPLSQGQVAYLLGVSERRVQQLEQQAMTKIRDGLVKHFPAFVRDRIWEGGEE